MVICVATPLCTFVKVSFHVDDDMNLFPQIAISSTPPDYVLDIYHWST